MTETEWLAAKDPGPMLEFLRSKAGDRQLRLFACGCCRHVWELLGEVSREAVEVAERFAVGKASENELTSAHRRAEGANRVLADILPHAYDVSRDEGEATSAAVHGLEAAAHATSNSAYEGAVRASVCGAHGAGTAAARRGAPQVYIDSATYVKLETAGRNRAFERQCNLLRELVGNPFRTDPPSPPHSV